MRRYLSAGLLVLFLATACSTAPLHYYALNGIASREAAVTEDTTEKVSLSVVINPITLPEMVDRPQLVTLSRHNEIEIHETHRWATSLKQGIPYTVAQNLNNLLENIHVTVAPQYVITDPDYTVQLDIQRFDSIPGQSARIDALWTIRHSRSGNVQSNFDRLAEPYSGEEFDGMVAAHSRMLMKLSENISRAIRSMDNRDVVR